MNRPIQSGYCDCACSTCFEIAICEDYNEGCPVDSEGNPALCGACESAGCDGEGECECECECEEEEEDIDPSRS